MTHDIPHLRSSKISSGASNELDNLMVSHELNEQRNVVSKRNRAQDKIRFIGKCIAEEIKQNVLSYFICIIFILVSVMNKVFMKRVTKKANNYGFVILETQIAVSTVIYFFIYIIHKSFKKEIQTPSKTPFKFYLGVSIFDGLSMFIGFIGIIKTAGNVQAFITQLSIPINMFFCYIIFKYKYHVLNYLGASIILIVIATMEIIMYYEEGKVENSIPFNLIYVSSLIPACFSNITREVSFTKFKTNIFKLLFFVGFLQFFISFLILPLYSLPILEQVSIPFSELPDNLKAGIKCLFLRENTIITNCGDDQQKSCDDCSEAWKLYMIYAIFNISDNLMSCFLIEHFSALTYIIVSCLQGPSTAIAYYFKFIAGDAYTTPKVTDFLILIGYIIGSVVYRTGNIILEKKKEKEKEKEIEEKEEREERETVAEEIEDYLQIENKKIED